MSRKTSSEIIFTESSNNLPDKKSKRRTELKKAPLPKDRCIKRAGLNVCKDIKGNKHKKRSTLVLDGAELTTEQRSGGR